MKYADTGMIWRVESPAQCAERMRLDEPWACPQIAWLEGRVCDHSHPSWLLADLSDPPPALVFELFGGELALDAEMTTDPDWERWVEP